MLYKISNGAVTFGNKTVLEDINFEVKNREHVAIVGRNGCGKTTLLRAIVGEVELESGLLEDDVVVIKLGNPKIGYVEQNMDVDDSTLMLDEVLKAYCDIIKVERRLETLSFQLENEYQEQILNEYQDLQFYYQTIGGYSYRKEYETAIQKFGFREEDKYKPLKEFSYGQRTKISFLRLILSKPDLLLLDEPTNHLDVLAIEWLEKYLSTYPKAFVIISHDRMFLDRVCDVTYAVEYGAMKRYAGNYSYYLKQRKIDYQRALKDYEYQQKEIDRLTKIVERFRYKPTKAGMALSKLKQIERMVKLENPREFDRRSFPTQFRLKMESYRDVLKVKHLEFGYDRVLGCVDLSLERGERLGIIGENGAGKSTFLKTLVGEVAPIAGKYVFGGQTELGYLEQNVESLNEEDSVLEVMMNEFPLVDVKELRDALGAFEFHGDMVFQQVKSLSGGQKVKLLLCKLMAHRPNVLLLDEPTNHLDIIGKETFEQLLLQYKGTVIFVSHDRYFVQKIATQLLVFENGEVHFYPGDYAYYLDKSATVNVGDFKPKEVSNLKHEYVSEFKEKSKLERKLKKVEEEIQRLEDQKQSYYQEMLKREVYLDFDKMRELEFSVQQVDHMLEEKMQEWEKVSLELEQRS